MNAQELKRQKPGSHISNILRGKISNDQITKKILAQDFLVFAQELLESLEQMKLLSYCFHKKIHDWKR